MENEKLALSIAECAKELGISKACAYNMAKDGQLPTLKCRKRIVVPVEALKLWLATQTVVPNE